MKPRAQSSALSASVAVLSADKAGCCPKPRHSISSADVQIYLVCDQLGEVLIYLMVLFSPWAFGTTQTWSIWTMNVGGYALGALLGIKLLIRYVRGYQPARWASAEPHALERRHSGSFFKTRHLTRALAVLTILILAFCLVAALNSRATFDDASLTFVYHECIRWLPHSFDSAATWSALWMYLGLAFFFWAVRYWLGGKSSGEQRAEWQRASSGASDSAPPFPQRLRRLLWLLAINGALLAAEAVVQRAADSPKLLFLVKPRIHQTADGQFGPYAYRSNAAQYFNLLWPVCVGFWWTLNRGSGARRKSQNVLLVSGAAIAAAAIMSTSRAGAIVTVLISVVAGLMFAATHPSISPISRRHHQGRVFTLRALAIFFIGALAFGFALGWKTLGPRLAELNDGLDGREQMYDAARPIAHDFPVFGTGPGSFETVSQLYPRPDIFWPAQLHNDWLETRITFGWVGSALIALTFLCIILRWWLPGGIHGGRRFVVLTWLALGGCMLHARFDFPFQIHSTLFLFLLLCGILSILSRRPA
jgi:hypothetical protein